MPADGFRAEEIDRSLHKLVWQPDIFDKIH